MADHPLRWQWELPPVLLIDLVRYAGASGDFNPMHIDAELARQEGFPTNFAHGMFGAGMLGVLLAEHVGPERIRRLGMRFVSPLWCGAVPVATVAVTSRNDHRVAVELELVADGRVVTTGWAELSPQEGGANDG